MLRLATYDGALRGFDGPRSAVLIGEAVHDLRAAHEALAKAGKVAAEPSLACTNSVLCCPEAQALARQVAERLAAGDVPAGLPKPLPLTGGRLLPPVWPNKLFALAGNYAEHIMESRDRKTDGRLSAADTTTPRIFMKPPSNSLCGYGEPIYIPPGAQFVDWEAEVGVVIGRRGRNIPREAALDYVAGLTIVNDVSERELRIVERAETREWDRFFDWLNGKWGDHFAPMGPCVVPLADIADPDRLALKLWVNDQLQQNGSTGQMIFKIPDIIAYLSAICTIEPGDVIATGTPSGVGYAQGTRLKSGDTVRIELEGVGTLVNPVEEGP